MLLYSNFIREPVTASVNDIISAGHVDRKDLAVYQYIISVSTPPRPCHCLMWAMGTTPLTLT